MLVETRRFRDGDPEWPVSPAVRHVAQFDWMDFLAEATMSNPQGWPEMVSHRVVNVKSDPWYGTNDFPDAVTLARYGWSDGAGLIHRFTEATYDKVSSLVILPEIRYSEVPGMDVDIERYLEGEPQCWRDVRDISREGPGRAVRVVFNLSASAAVAPRVLMARGAAVAALVQLLELSGVRTEMVVGFCTQNSMCGAEVYVTLKHADEAVDPSTLAFGICHPAMSRRLMLSVIEKFPKQVRDSLEIRSYGDYGWPGELSNRGDLYIGNAVTGDIRWANEEVATQWVVKMLAESGVSLKDDAQEYLEVTK